MNKPHIAGSQDAGWLVFSHDRPQIAICETWDDVKMVTLAMNLPLGLIEVAEPESLSVH